MPEARSSCLQCTQGRGQGVLSEEARSGDGTVAEDPEHARGSHAGILLWICPKEAA